MIDWQFICTLEDGSGGCALKGYWPGGLSGVTIANGLDLGYYSAAMAKSLAPDLQEKIAPFVGLKGIEAESALLQQSLVLSEQECEALESPKRAEMIETLSGAYHRATGHDFEALPDAAQTVMMSLQWQYGSLPTRCPHFWSLCCAQDWAGAVNELRHFGDKYPTRRNREADYLAARAASLGVSDARS